MTNLVGRIAKVMDENKDGCSINPVTGETTMFDNGYFVALTDNEVTSEVEKEIEKLQAVASTCNVSAYFFGYWEDQNTGKKFLDLSVHVTDLTVAKAMARIYNQKAIFDCANFDSVYCQ